MTGCHAYLDSSTLADLRELFASGVDVSEVLVLMLTPGLLTRPWCLLEIRRVYACRHNSAPKHGRLLRCL
jgi:hypothetical protein